MMPARTPRFGVLVAWLPPAAWGALWILPWQGALGSPWARVGLALLLFVLPGMAILRLLSGPGAMSSAPLLVRGLVVSCALLGVLGLGASVLHLPAAAVRAGFFTVGGGLLVLSALWAPLIASLRVEWGSLAGLVPWLLCLALVATLSGAPWLSGDMLAYAARIHYFSLAPQLGFEESILGTGNLMPPRYWIMYWPLAKALVGSLSGLDALELMAFGLAPVLAPLALIAHYVLARDLGLSPGMARFATLGQTAALLLAGSIDQPGRVFFHRLVEDKVAAAFLLGPVFLGVVAEAAVSPKRHLLYVLLLVGLGFAFTHPVHFGLASLIAVPFVLLHALATREWRRILPLLILLLLLPAAVASLRFVELTPAHRRFAIQDLREAGELTGQRTKRLLTWPDSRQVAVHPSLYRATPFVAVLLGVAVALGSVARLPLARFLVACGLLLSAAAIPAVGWMLAMAITPFLLWRVPWLAPFGLAVAFLAQRAGERVPRLATPAALAMLQTAVVAACVLRASSPPWSLFERPRDVARRVPLHTQLGWPTPRPPCAVTYEQLREIAQALEGGAPARARVAGDELLNDVIPSLSMKVRLLRFRGPDETAIVGGLSRPEAVDRFAQWQILMGPRTKLQERIRVARSWDVRYLLVCGVPEWLERWAASDARVRPVARAGPVHLYESPAS